MGLSGVSVARRDETWIYDFRRREFLSRHPYCQVWIAEHGVEESSVIRLRGKISIAGNYFTVPLATEVHHRNKRRRGDLLEERFWLAVSSEAHRRIEREKGWARERGYLLNF